MLGSKGQVEMPFELLLAVAMLVMLMPIVFFMFNQFQDWECQQRIGNNMETLARDIELAATLGGGVRTIEVDMGTYGCDRVRVDNFTISSPGNDKCLELCHDPNCRLMSAVYTEYSYEGENEILAAMPDVCIRIPFNIDFTTQGCRLIGYSSVDEQIDPKNHRFLLTKQGYTVQFCEEELVR